MAVQPVLYSRQDDNADIVSDKAFTRVLGLARKTVDGVSPDVSQAINDILSLYNNLHVGWARAVYDNLEKTGLLGKVVHKADLPPELQKLYDEYYANSPSKDYFTWGDLAKMAEDRAWKMIDEQFMKIVKGDHSEFTEFFKNVFRGSDATSNIIIAHTADGRLTEMKKYLESVNYWGQDRNTVRLSSAFFDASQKTWNNRPTTEYELMQLFDMVARGKTDGIPIIAQALNEGWAGVYGYSKISVAVIKPGSALDKLLGDKDPSDPTSRFNLTYGQLLDRVAEEGRTASETALSTLTQRLSELHGLLASPGFKLGTPGNDPRTILQNLDNLAKELDLENDNGLLAQIGAKYAEVYEAMMDVEALNISSSPSMKKYIEERVADILKLHESTGVVMDSIANYLTQTAENIKYIKDEAKERKVDTILAIVLFGASMLGSMGFGVSNWRAVWGIGNQKEAHKGWYKAMNFPAFLGSMTLLSANSFNVGLNAKNIQSLQALFGKLNMSSDKLTGLEETLSTVKQAYEEAFENMELAMRRVDAIVNEPERFFKYLEWANNNKQQSSFFNPGVGDDSGYDGPPPIKWWERYSTIVERLYAFGSMDDFWNDKNAPDWLKGYY